MASVSKVQKSDGTVIMDISQDTVAANNLLAGETAHGSDGEAVTGMVNLNDYVLKAGDTMSGTLKMQAASAASTVNIELINTNIDRDGADPSDNVTGNTRIIVKDKDGEQIGLISPIRNTDGRQALYLAVNNEKNGSTVSNYIILYVDKSGTQTYSVSNKEAFRTAILKSDADEILRQWTRAKDYRDSITIPANPMLRF